MSDRVKELVEAGSVLSRAGDSDGAIRLLEEALRLAPEDVRARELHTELTRGRRMAPSTPFAPPPPDLFADARKVNPITNPFARSTDPSPDASGVGSPAGRTPELTDPYGNAAATGANPTPKGTPAARATMPFAGPASPAFGTLQTPAARPAPKTPPASVMPGPVRFFAAPEPASEPKPVAPAPAAPQRPDSGFWGVPAADAPRAGSLASPPPSSKGTPEVSHRFGTPPRSVAVPPKPVVPPPPPPEALREATPPPRPTRPPSRPEKKLAPPAFVELFADVTPQPVPEHRPRSNPEMHDPLSLIEVPEKPAAAPPKPPPTALSELDQLLKDAKSQLDFADHSGALVTLEKILATHPAHPEALRMKAKCEATLVSMYESKLGNLGRKPTLKLRPDEVIWLNLDHRAGFVLAQIDGMVTLEDIFTLSGMTRLDTARILAQLVEEKVIKV